MNHKRGKRLQRKVNTKVLFNYFFYLCTKLDFEKNACIS